MLGMIDLLHVPSVDNCTGSLHRQARFDGTLSLYCIPPKVFLSVLQHCDFDGLEALAACSRLLHGEVMWYLKESERKWSLSEKKGMAILMCE